MGSLNLADTPSWRAALAQAEASGWRVAATGDWSWVYRSPEGDRAWRITPFDPAFRAFIDICLASSNRHLPRLEGVHEHAEGGYSVIMEWLDPVPEPSAAKWFDQFEKATDGEIAEARRLLVDAAASIELPLFAGLDKTPANLLRRQSDGAYVFTDAFWIDGRRLFEMIETRPADALALFSADSLEHWAHLPCMDTRGTDLILRAIGR